jgi:hypothetical protein
MTRDTRGAVAIFVIVLLVMALLAYLGYDHWSTLE